MKKFVLLMSLLIFSPQLFSMIRAGVDVGPDPYYYYDPYDSGWHGPGFYYGVYYSDYPSYYAWRRRYYYGGPYYWRSRYYDGYRHGYYRDGRYHRRND